MQILVVIGNRQRITFLPKVAPIERHIRIGKHIRQIGHTLFIGKIGRTAGDRGLHVVTHVHLRKVSSYAYPVSETVAKRDILTLGLYTNMIHIGSAIFTSAQIRYIPLDIIFGISVDQSAFHIYGMLTECLVEA